MSDVRNPETPMLLRLLRLLHDEGRPMTTGEIAARLRWRRDSVSTRLSKARKKNLVKKLRHGLFTAGEATEWAHMKWDREKRCYVRVQ